MNYISQPKDYWIANNALVITRNALGDPNRIQASVATGAAIMCWINNVSGLDYDNGHQYRTWPLVISPTYFGTNTEKYVYVAIPRIAMANMVATVVFPSEKLDIYGKNANDEQVGSSDYYYIWLQGILSATNGTSERVWTAEINSGLLDTDQARDAKTDETGWYSYSRLTDIVTFLKEIAMDIGASFKNLILDHKELTTVATDDAVPTDSTTAIVTPAYMSDQTLSSKDDDTANGLIGFVKGIWVGVKGLFGWDADGNIGVNNAAVGGTLDVQGQATMNDIKSRNYTGDGIADSGWRLTNDYNGHSKLTVDELYVRMKLTAEALEIKKELVAGGNQVQSCAASTISKVDYLRDPLSGSSTPFSSMTGDTLKYYGASLTLLRGDTITISGGGGEYIGLVYDDTESGSKQEIVKGKNSVTYTSNEEQKVYFACAVSGKSISYSIASHELGYCDIKVPFTLRNAVMMLTRGQFRGLFSKTLKKRFPLSATDRIAIYRIRCYFLAEENGRKIQNWWQTHDLARCQTFNLAANSVSERDNYWGDNTTKTGNIFWWRKVVNVSTNPVEIEGKMYHYFDVSYNSAASGSDMPAPGDEVSQWGNDNNVDRMNLIVTEVNGQDAAIKMYEGINKFSMETGLYGNPLKIRFAPKTGCKVHTTKWEVVTENFVAPVPVECGNWNDITPVQGKRIARYYEIYQHNGSSWLCVASAANAFKVIEAFSTYSVGDTISQTTYNGLTVNQQLCCSRIALGTTTDEPSTTSADWMVYARGADVWTIGSDGYWYLNGTLYTDTDHPNGIKAEGKDGTGVELKGSVDVLYNADKTSPSQTSLEGLTMTSANIGECYVVNANRHLYFYNGNSVSFPNNWNDIGEFKGEAGDDAYMHIAYADSITTDSGGNVTAQSGFSVVKQKDAYNWIGLRADHTEQDPGASASTEAEKLLAAQQYKWNYVKGTKGDDGKDATEVNPNILLRTVFEEGLNFIKEKWSANSWDGITMDSSADTQYIDGRQSIRMTVAASGEIMVGQSVLGKLKPDTWYTFSWYSFASADYIMYVYNAINGTRTNIFVDNKVIVDGVEVTVTDNGHNDVPITGSWDGKRHYVTFKTRSSGSISDTNLDIGWYMYNQTANAAYFVYCMPKLEIGQVATAYMANEDDLRGEDGKDGWMVTANPANVIITQALANNVSTFSAATVGFVAKKGSVAAPIVSLGMVTWNQFYGIKSGNTVIVQRPESSDGVYYTEGSFTVIVNVTDPDTNQTISFAVTVLCYANLLGSWKTQVIGDTETSVAQKLSKGIDPTQQTVYTLEQFGQYTRSASENVSILESTATKKNLFGIGAWVENDPPSFPAANYDGAYDRYYSDDYDDIYSPVIYLKAGTYCFSGYVPSGRNFDTNSNTIALQQSCSVSDPSQGTTVSATSVGTVNGDTITIDGATYYRRYAVFEVSADSYCSVNLWGSTGDADIAAPKIITGSSPDPDKSMSTMRQVGDQIDFIITNKLGETGIHIDGEQRKIELKANNTIVDGSFTAPNINSIGEGTYSHIIGGHFELGIVKESNTQQPAFLLETDTNGNAVLRYLDKDGNTIGVIDSSFFNQSAVGDTWTEYRGVAIEYSGEQPTFEEVQLATNTGQGYVYYQFHEGYVTNGEYRTYNVSRSSSPSKYDGKWFKGKATKHGTDYNFASPMDGGFYIKPKTIPFATLTEDGKVVYVYNVQSALFNRFDNTTEIVDIKIDDDN